MARITILSQGCNLPADTLEPDMLMIRLIMLILLIKLTMLTMLITLTMLISLSLTMLRQYYAILSDFQPCYFCVTDVATTLCISCCFFREKMEELQKAGGFLENAEFSGL